MQKSNLFKTLCAIFIFCIGVSFMFSSENSTNLVHADANTVISIDGSSFSINSVYYTMLVNSYPNFSSGTLQANIPDEYCMRDEFMLPTQMQGSHGICWAFAGNTSLATTIMKATNQYYNFSEAWTTASFNHLSHDSSLKSQIGASGDYYIGGGGNFVYFDVLSQYYGVVLEQDFSFEDLQVACDENVDDIVSNISPYATSHILENVQAGKFDLYEGNTSSEKETKINYIKQHIMNHGSVYASYDWSEQNPSTNINNKTIYYKEPNVSGGGHAVSLIGWDDDISLKINGTTYTGAWIILNSWGNDNGDDGIYYVFYDDTTLNSLWGYKYEENKEGLYLTTSIEDSSESYTTDLRGAYYGNFSATTGATKQKNIFYKDDIYLTYSYDISSDASVDSVNIYCQEEDIGGNFFTQVDSGKKEIKITGQDVNPGAYKVLIKYKNGTETETSVNNFYVFDGTEMSYVQYNFNFTDSNDYLNTNDGGTITNNGMFQLINENETNDKDIIVASSNTSGVLIAFFNTSTYSNVSSITSSLGGVYVREETSASKGKYAFNIYYNLSNQTVYPFTVTTNNGLTKTINVNIMPATTSQTMVRVFYETNGGENGENNLKHVLLGSSGSVVLQEPTRGGYKFMGWYTDSGFTSALAKSGTDYLLKYSKIELESSPTYDSSMHDYNSNFYAKSAYVFLYAKWMKLAVTHTVTINYNNGSGFKTEQIEEGMAIVEPMVSYEGHRLVGWYTDPDFKTPWDFSAGIMCDISLYAKWEKINYYSVTINYNNGTPSTSYTVESGEQIVAPTVSYEGYKLVGWYSDSSYTAEWNFSTPVTGNVTLYAKWERIYYTVMYVYNNGTPSSSQKVEYGESLEEPSVSYLGYTFGGWYTDSSFTNLWDFSTVLTKSITLYAKWTFNAPTNLKLSSSTTTYLTYTGFSVSLNFDHEIKDSCEIEINWYKDGALLETTSSATITQTILEAGSHTYSAKLKISHNGNTIEVELPREEALQIVVNERPVNITNITYNLRGNFSWKDDDIATYVVNLYKKEANGDTLIGSKNVVKYTKSISVWELIESGGVYYINIEKTVGEDLIGAINSNTFTVVELNYVTFMENATGYETETYDVGEEITGAPIAPQMQGYTFDNWYLNSDYSSAMQYPYLIEENLTLYANWILDGITSDEISDINEVYQKGSSYQVVVNATHIVTGEYSYKWFKTGTDGDFEIDNQTNAITFSVAGDSGSYYCEITLIDTHGFSVTSHTNTFAINIEKAETSINTASIRKVFTYNGQEQKIVSGARLNRLDDEMVDLVYSNNSFTNVPEGGKQIVMIFAPETKNYKSASASVEITINKAQSVITAEDYQSVTYTGKKIVPKYTLNNTEQTVSLSENVVNAGKYSNVTLIARESQNYLTSDVVITIEVMQAVIVVKVKDVTSIWLFPAKELECEVSGEYNDSIEITLTCDVDVYKIGTYDIKISIDNPNYIVTPIEGVYTVTGMPYYIAFAILALIIGLAIFIHSKKKYLIDFNENGGSLIAPIESTSKKSLVIDEPVRKGYDFVGWYYDPSLTKPFNNKFKKGKLLTLYAKWEEAKVVNARDRSVESILEELNIKPKKAIDVEPEVVEISPNEETETTNENIEVKKEPALSEIINRANSTSNKQMSKEELNKVLNRLSLTEFKIEKPKVEEKEEPKELTIDELIKKAHSEAYSKSIDEDVLNLIDGLTKKDN